VFSTFQHKREEKGGRRERTKGGKQKNQCTRECLSLSRYFETPKGKGKGGGGKKKKEKKGQTLPGNRCLSGQRLYFLRRRGGGREKREEGRHAYNVWQYREGSVLTSSAADSLLRPEGERGEKEKGEEGREKGGREKEEKREGETKKVT